RLEFDHHASLPIQGGRSALAFGIEARFIPIFGRAVPPNWPNVMPSPFFRSADGGGRIRRIDEAILKSGTA
ncbi:MAG TPA: hypothetical protein VHS97_00960, partial [Isosphaeraceae bacterium]|nr:hypothetical protein [Isosphaeraceae bacterium]